MPGIDDVVSLPFGEKFQTRRTRGRSCGHWPRHSLTWTPYMSRRRPRLEAEEAATALVGLGICSEFHHERRAAVRTYRAALSPC